MDNKQEIVIIGGGAAGCFMAILMAKRGYHVNIYETSTKEQIINLASKRSFNMTLYGYAEQILKETGLWKCLEPNLLMLKGSMTQFNRDSKPIFTQADIPYYTISRAHLTQTLLQETERNSLISIHYHTTLVSINRQEKTIIVSNLHSKKNTVIHCDVILGADGVNSLVRPFLQQGQKTSHLQKYGEWEYKQFIITEEQAKKN